MKKIKKDESKEAIIVNVLKKYIEDFTKGEPISKRQLYIKAITENNYKGIIFPIEMQDYLDRIRFHKQACINKKKGIMYVIPYYDTYIDYIENYFSNSLRESNSKNSNEQTKEDEEISKILKKIDENFMNAFFESLKPKIYYIYWKEEGEQFGTYSYNKDEIEKVHNILKNYYLATDIKVSNSGTLFNAETTCNIRPQRIVYLKEKGIM